MNQLSLLPELVPTFTRKKEPNILVDIPVDNSCPDCFFPSDNDYGIPLLDITKQGDYIDIPVLLWGSKKRSQQTGTMLFYTEDYRFEALWKKPDNLLKSPPVNMGEINFSIYKDFPRALALYQIYRKRWLSRYYQTRGIRIFVDLNVNQSFYNLNLMGVPRGWQSYCTRGYSDRLEQLEIEIEIAEKHASPNSILLLVYGGGVSVRSFCKEKAYKNILWIQDYINDKFIIE
jgi:hypothetical protein